jgi:hypothetical protein
MNVADLTGITLDYWVARGLTDFVREIYFTDSGAKVAVRGNDRGKPWDGRFTPSTSWEAAGVVLERATRFEVRECDSGQPVRCIAEFQGSEQVVEASGECVRIALLRAFVVSRFGDKVGQMLRHPQVLFGERIEPVAEPSAVGDVADVPTPDGRIGDIGSPPR